MTDHTPDAPAERHVHATQQVTTWVRDALRTHAIAEPVLYDVVFTLQGRADGAMIPTIVVFLQIPSALLGQVLGEIVGIPIEQARTDTVDQVVAATMQKLYQRRFQAALPTAPAPTNGRKLR